MRAPTRKRMIRIMAGAGLVAILSFSWLGQAAAGARTASRHQHRNVDKRDLTDQQWKILDPLVPEPARRRDGRGRPWKERRAVLNGILWVLRTGAPWAELPDRYPSYQTCHRRFQ